MVVVENISKSFRKVEALKNINFKAKSGELYGIIGPDGAGKTTLFRIMATLTLPDAGRVEIDGMDVVKDFMAVRQYTGYMPGRFALYQDLTVEENLEFFASVYNTKVSTNYDLIKSIYSHIEPFKNRQAGKLSGGMKQKLALSCALIHKPQVLLLDEPTTGVDPVSRREFWDILKDLKLMGITIIVSTPYMDEASLCDRIGLIKNGSFISEDTPLNIINNFSLNLISIKSSDMRRLLSDVRSSSEIDSAYAFGAEVHAVIDDYGNMSALADFLKQKEHKEIIIEKVKPSIEDCYIWSR